MIIIYRTGNSNVPSIQTAAGTALAANATRNGWLIQNLGTSPLFVLLGTGASTTIFHMVLKGAAVQDDGSGGVLSEFDGVVYTGAITVAGTTPRFTVLEV